MDDYPYATLGADGWLRCDGLHRPGFLTRFQDVFHRFGHTGLPRTMVARIVSLGVEPARSMWTSWLTLSTRA
jgi:hypothetical protein